MIAVQSSGLLGRPGDGTDRELVDLSPPVSREGDVARVSISIQEMIGRIGINCLEAARATPDRSRLFLPTEDSEFTERFILLPTK